MKTLINPDMDHLVKKWAHVIEATKHIQTFTTDRELSWLAEYATWTGHMLEIGSWRGRSAKVMLLANPGMCLTSLDTWDDAGTFEEYQHNLGPEIGEGRVNFHRGSSQMNIIGTCVAPYDGCFIDGGHEEHLVRTDIIKTKAMMLSGKLMAGHDYRSNGGPNDVARGVLSIGHAVLRPVDSIWAIQL